MTRLIFRSVIGLFLLLALVNNVSHEVGWEDSGELTVSSWHLSLAHPPGFPLYILGARTCQMIPLGTIAYRTNLFSALTAFVVIIVLFNLVQRVTKDTVSALLSCLFLTLTPQFLLHSSVAEIYMLQVFMIIIPLLLLIQSGCTDERKTSLSVRELYLAFFCAGLGISLQPVMLVYYIPLFYYGTRFSTLRSGHKLSLFRDYTAPFFMVILGSSVNLYLLFRGGVRTMVHWGPIRNAGELADHLTARVYREGFAEMEMFPHLLIIKQRILQFCEPFTWGIVILLPLIGLGMIPVPRWKLVQKYVLVLLTIDLLFTLYINPMGISNLQTGLVSLLCGAFFAGLGVSRLFSLLGVSR